MGSIRRSATSSLEAGEATWLAWTSSTEQPHGEVLSYDTHYQGAANQNPRQPRPSSSSDQIAAFAQQNDGFDADSHPLKAETLPLNSTAVADDARMKALAPCSSAASQELGDDDGAEEFEPVGDPPSLPRLDYKPIVLREWTLVIISIFYLSLVLGLGVLYYYENEAKIFHIHATASRFTIRILPALIGSLSTILFQSVISNFARIMPYIIIAKPTSPGDKCAIAQRTVLAAYFPFLNMFNSLKNKDFYLAAMMATVIYVNPFVTPAKSTLFNRTTSKEDPNVWTITISGGAARYLLVNYSILFITVFGLLLFLWDRRTELRWDPVSIADHMMLLQSSNIFKDFWGLEYMSPSFLESSGWSKQPRQFETIEHQSYRLGYWRYRRSGQYWYGIRKWPDLRKDPEVLVLHETRAELTQEARAGDNLDTRSLTGAPITNSFDRHQAVDPHYISRSDSKLQYISLSDPELETHDLREMSDKPSVTDHGRECHLVRFLEYFC